MKVDDIKSIAIIGSGTMGSGIAQISAMAGLDVLLYDISEEAVDKAIQIITGNLDKGIERGKVTEEQKNETLTRIKKELKFENLVADIILEAIIEKLEVKVELFTKLAAQNSEKTILATNTSSIPITRIAAGTPGPERVIGFHFFNPAHIMKLVEIISGAATDPEITLVVKELAIKMGKSPVIAADSPGFIVNRVARHFYVEGLKIMEEGVADLATIDELVESSAFKMGPFRLMDLLGVDSNFRVTSSMYESFHYDQKFRPSRIQEQKVDAGHWGRKNGRGFYDYSQ